MKTQGFFIDLTERPPRGFRGRLGGFVILARMIDKGRATLSKKNAEYVGQLSQTREDIKTWFKAAELDDYVSFGGRP